MAILRGFPPSNTITLRTFPGGDLGPLPPKVKATVIMPDRPNIHSILPEHDPDVGEFHIDTDEQFRLEDKEIYVSNISNWNGARNVEWKTKTSKPLRL